MQGCRRQPVVDRPDPGHPCAGWAGRGGGCRGGGWCRPDVPARPGP